MVRMSDVEAGRTIPSVDGEIEAVLAFFRGLFQPPRPQAGNSGVEPSHSFHPDDGLGTPVDTSSSMDDGCQV